MENMQRQKLVVMGLLVFLAASSHIHSTGAADWTYAN